MHVAHQPSCLPRTLLWRQLLCCFSLILIFSSTIFAQNTEATPAPQNTAASDSIAAWKQANHSRSTWETLVSLPGEIAYLPLRLLFLGMENGISAVYERKLIERINNALTSDDGLTGLRPQYTSAGGLGLKLFQKDLFNKGSRLNIGASGGLQMRQRYYLELNRLRLFGGKASGGALLRYQNLPSERFYGIGADSDEDNQSNFALEQYNAELRLGPYLSPKTDIELVVGFEQNNIFPGRDTSLPRVRTPFVDGDSLDGFETEVRLLSFQANLGFDFTDHPGNPTSGLRGVVGSGIYQQLGASEEYGFSKTRFDLQQHVHLLYGRSLAFRLAGEVNKAFSDKRVPFYYLSELGRLETVRGFTRGRFRDNDMLFGSVEFRYPLRVRRDGGFSAALFVDGGRVYEDLTGDFGLEDLEISYGLGINIWNNSGIITKIEFAKSSERFRVNFQLN